VAVALWAVCAGTAAAQSIAPPGGDLGGLFGRRTTAQDVTLFGQELSVLINAGVGHDRNTDLDGRPLPIGTFGNLQSGAVQVVDASATYLVGRQGKSLSATARGFSTFASQGIGRIAGSSAQIQGQVPLSRRAELFMTTDAAYDPAVLFNAFGPVLSQIESGSVPGAAPTQGVDETHWLTLTGNGGGRYNWTPRQRSQASYTLSDRSSREGPRFSSRFNSVAASHAWAPRERLAFEAVYRLDHQEQIGPGIVEALRVQAFVVSMEAEKRLSARRRLRMNVGGGAAFGASDPNNPRATDRSYVVPTYSALARVNISRGWEIAADSRRDIAVLRGVTPEPFTIDAASLRLSGNLGERVRLELASGVAKGQARTRIDGAFDAVTSNAQITVALSRHTALGVSYSDYRHRLRDAVTFDPQFPSAFRRAALRIGVGVWLPILGRF